MVLTTTIPCNFNRGGHLGRRRKDDGLTYEDHRKLESPLAPTIPSQQYAFVPLFELESGILLHNVRVAYTVHGDLNPTQDNVVVVCHALSGSADAKGDWWTPLFEGPGAALNVPGLFVICLNVLGSPYGTTSPLTYKDEDWRKGRWGPDFPCTSVRDDVRLHKLVLDVLGVKQVAMVIGGSMGGMQSLEWAYLGEDYVRCVVAIACSAQHSAWSISWNEMQRSAIRVDPKFCRGHYNLANPPTDGLAVARMAAMLTYRARGSLQRRFGRRMQHRIWRKQAVDGQPSTREDALTVSPNLSTAVNPDRGCFRPDPNTLFAVESYFEYQGDKFNRRFDANCYIAITEKLDTHDLTRGRSDPASSHRVKDALRQVTQPVLVIGIDGDVLYPLEEQKQLADGLSKSQFEVLISDDGHDAFLLESERINCLVAHFMSQWLPELMASASTRTDSALSVINIP